MIRSLRTGVTGLKSNQTRLDVVGNNISNANTVAFKRGRAAFNEVLGQKLLGVGRTAGGSGINPSHVGLGVSVGSIDQNWDQGSLENTGIQTDLALSGDGFFIASPQDGTGSNQRMLTRAGNFTFNERGEFVTANGLNVQGWQFETDPGTGEEVLRTGQLKDVRLDPNAQSAAKFTSESTVGGNLSADAAVGDTTSISTVVYDEQGKAHDVVIDFEKTAANEWSYTVDAADPTNSPFGGAATGTLTFDTTGAVTGAGGTASINWDGAAVAGSESIDLDLTGLTQFAGSTTATFESQNGRSAGELAGFSFTPEGVLELNFTNGEQKKLFQLAIGNINNPNGLEQQGENFYTTTSASGDLQLGRAGRDLRTSVVAGTLESSNVDLATEFTEMIVAQRGYQAAARVVTTSDELLQETVQLKR
jgi:flagellar hook protein FlgE